MRQFRWPVVEERKPLADLAGSTLRKPQGLGASASRDLAEGCSSRAIPHDKRLDIAGRRVLSLPFIPAKNRGMGGGRDLDNTRGCDWSLPLGLSWPFKLHSSSLPALSAPLRPPQLRIAQDRRDRRLGPVPKDHNCQETRNSLECQKQARGKCGVTSA